MYVESDTYIRELTYSNLLENLFVTCKTTQKREEKNIINDREEIICITRFINKKDMCVCMKELFCCADVYTFLGNML